jgi:hypothetical protein
MWKWNEAKWGVSQGRAVVGGRRKWFFMKPREGKRALRPRHVFIDSELNCPSQFQKHSFFFFP